MSDGAFTITYAVDRATVWAWYWRMWWRKLWQFHLAILIMGFAAGYAVSKRGMAFWPCPTSAVVVIAGMVAWPQVMYKPQTRILSFGPEGFQTKINDKHEAYQWSAVAAIEDRGDEVVIQLKNLNAFLIPASAFRNKTTALRLLAAWSALPKGA